MPGARKFTYVGRAQVLDRVEGMLPAFRVIGFDHVVLLCADVERSLAFYTERLGLVGVRVDEWRRGEVPFPSVRITDTSIIDLFPGVSDGRNVDHVCLVIDSPDIDEIAATFEGSKRGDRLFGAQGFASSVYLPDPDGHIIELRCYDS
jgi:catechol 2,3-dioxygenase-like lactoylglutathione lyase family enzyme